MDTIADSFHNKADNMESFEPGWTRYVQNIFDIIRNTFCVVHMRMNIFPASWNDYMARIPALVEFQRG